MRRAGTRCYCVLDDASVSWGTMRPRMGFAPVRIVAPRRRQDPFGELARLDGVPPIAGFAAPARE